jgi:large subunit ribosomal protein L31
LPSAINFAPLHAGVIRKREASEQVILYHKFAVLANSPELLYDGGVIKSETMKKDIHPKYYPNAQIKCSCGRTYQIGSSKEYLETETCAACHPFYTGKARLIGAMGRVDRFLKKVAKRDALKTGKKANKV